MLKFLNDKAYYVYPPWAQFSYSWRNLPDILRDPLQSGYLDPQKNWRSFGFPPTVKPASFIHGPVGGGIVVSTHAPGERWLPENVLGKEATITAPRAMYQCSGRIRVYYLEPRDEEGAECGLGHKAKLYVPAVSAENVDSEPNRIYWMLDLTTLQATDTLSELPGWVRQLGLEVERLEHIPHSLEDETRTWFLDPSLRFVWFTVMNRTSSADYLLAVTLYFALHLRRVLETKMRAMHLVANIEGRPNARFGWARR